MEAAAHIQRYGSAEMCIRDRYGTAFDPKRENWEPIQGHITFDDVTFRYPDGVENVLEHFSLDKMCIRDSG